MNYLFLFIFYSCIIAFFASLIMFLIALLAPTPRIRRKKAPFFFLGIVMSVAIGYYSVGMLFALAIH